MQTFFEKCTIILVKKFGYDRYTDGSEFFAVNHITIDKFQKKYIYSSKNIDKLLANKPQSGQFFVGGPYYTNITLTILILYEKIFFEKITHYINVQCSTVRMLLSSNTCYNMCISISTVRWILFASRHSMYIVM